MGGKSSEREVSMESGRAVAAALRRAGMKALEMDISEGFEEKLMRFRPKAAFLALHGGFGEDGGIQRALDSMGIAYTGSGPMASLVSMDKEISKRAFIKKGIPSPRCVCLSEGAGFAELERAVRELGLPLVVKPTSEGSSRGVSIAKSRLEVTRGLDEALKFSPRVMLEEYVKGREFDVAILDGTPLPLIEVVPSAEFFSYEAKYGDSGTRYIVNPELALREKDGIVGNALAAYVEVGCRHLARIEVILSEERGVPHVIEINTLPGMTSHSLFPMAAKAAGISMEDLCVRIAALALRS